MPSFTSCCSFSYLPAFPFKDNPIFHLYAGLISLHLSQFTQSNEGHDVGGGARLLACSVDVLTLRNQGVSASNYIRDAQAHIERAIRLNPHDPLLQSYRQKVRGLLPKPQITSRAPISFKVPCKKLRAANTTSQNLTKILRVTRIVPRGLAHRTSV
jgi:hypothetical protein